MSLQPSYLLYEADSGLETRHLDPEYSSSSDPSPLASPTSNPDDNAETGARIKSKPEESHQGHGGKAVRNRYGTLEESDS